MQRPIEKMRLHEKGNLLVPILNDLSNSFVLLYGGLEAQKSKESLLSIFGDIKSDNEKLKSLICINPEESHN